MNKSILMTTLLLAAGTTFGGDWMQWRGPELNGTCEADNLPVSWSVENKKNVAWTRDLAGTGSSTPIIVGNRIFLTASTPEYELYAIAIDRKTGAVEWKNKLGTGRKAAQGNNMASPSAVGNEARVVHGIECVRTGGREPLGRDADGIHEMHIQIIGARIIGELGKGGERPLFAGVLDTAFFLSGSCIFPL